MKIYSSGGKFSSNAKNTGKTSGRQVPPVSTPSNPEPSVQKPVENESVRPVPASSETVNQQPAVSSRPAPAQKASQPKRPAPSRKKPAKKRKELNIWVSAFLIFFSIMMATFLFLGVRKLMTANQFDHIIDQIQQAEMSDTTPTVNPVTPSDPTEPDDPVEPSDPDSENPDETIPEETEPTTVTPSDTILFKYQAVYESNPDFFGWIRMEDTVLNYPVMLSPKKNEKYLRADFNGKYSYAGTPFADNKCTRDSDNIMIYGHNLKDGGMFHSLLNYEKKSYWEKHPTVMFSDLYGDYEYEVVAAFRDRVYKKTDRVFKFYQFIDAEDEEDFDYAISQFKKKSLYDTGVEVEYGDKLITLVTCSYHVNNGRFVVVARRK